MTQEPEFQIRECRAGIGLRTGVKVKPIFVLKDYIYQELNESDYLAPGNNTSKFVKNIRSFCYKHLDLDDHEIRVICDYYKSIAEEVIEKWNEMAPLGRMGKPEELESICV